LEERKEKNYLMENKISVILLSPKYEGNVGATIRLLANFGLKNLIIVDPRVDLKSNEIKSLSVEAEKFVKIDVFDNLKDAIKDFSIIFATTSGRGRKKLKIEGIKNIEKYLKGIPEGSKIGLLFGPEDRGLSTEELLFANKIFRIPTNNSFPTLNLSHSIAIALYQLNLYKISEKKFEAKPSKKEMEGFFNHLKKVLLEIGFLHKNNPDRIMIDLKSIFSRALLDKRELKILRGILSQILLYPEILRKRGKFEI